MSDMLMAVLSAWGADVEGALSRMAGDREFYLEKLRSFQSSGEIEALKQAVEERRYKDAFALAHDIKGVTATLGLVPVYRAASPVVEDLRHEPLRSLEADLDRLQVEERILGEMLWASERGE